MFFTSCDRPSSRNVRVLRVQEALDSASCSRQRVCHLVGEERGCTVGLATVRFLVIFWVDGGIVNLPKAATLLLNEGLGSGVSDPPLPLFMRRDFWLVVFLGAPVAAAAALEGALWLVRF